MLSGNSDTIILECTLVDSTLHTVSNTRAPYWIAHATLIVGRGSLWSGQAISVRTGPLSSTQHTGATEVEADLDVGVTSTNGSWGSTGASGAATTALVPDVDAETRSKLKEIFDKFDLDGSGSVSTSEMKNMIQQLDLKLSDDDIAKLMRDADPDQSGQIDFEEFVTVMAGQMGKGGGLADVVAAAGSFFGWINPLSWFGK